MNSTQLTTGAPPSIRTLPLICTLLIALLGCDTAQSADMTPELWRQDLKHLERNLLKKHADPFASMKETAFRQAVAKLDVRIPTMNDAAIQVEMGRLVAMLQDGHTELWLPREGLGFRNYPFFLYDYEGEIYVRIAAKAFEHLLGATVAAVDSVPIDEIRAKVDPLIARDNHVEPLLSIPAYIGVPEILFGLGVVENADAASFTFEKDGEAIELDINAIGPEEAGTTEWIRAVSDDDRPLWSRNHDRYYWFEYLEESGTLYVKYNRCANQDGQPSVKKFAKALFRFFDANEVNRLVFDLRNNRGGNYHRSEPLIDGVVKRAAKLGNGKLFVITGRETFSAGMVTSLHFKQRADAFLVGEPGRSSPNGCENFEWFKLPNSKLRVDYTDKKEVRANEYLDLDVLPVDVPVSNSFEDYAQGRDRVLEAILAYDVP